MKRDFIESDKDRDQVYDVETVTSNSSKNPNDPLRLLA